MGKMMIDEMELLHTFVTAYKEGKRPESATGLWMGGTKYTITSNKTDEDLPKGEQDPIPWFFGAAPKKGVHFCITKSQVVAGFYSEEANQTTGICRIFAGDGLLRPPFQACIFSKKLSNTAKKHL